MCLCTDAGSSNAAVQPMYFAHGHATWLGLGTRHGVLWIGRRWLTIARWFVSNAPHPLGHGMFLRPFSTGELPSTILLLCLYLVCDERLHNSLNCSWQLLNGHLYRPSGIEQTYIRQHCCCWNKAYALTLVGASLVGLPAMSVGSSGRPALDCW